jgi:hypothetical protein
MGERRDNVISIDDYRCKHYEKLVSACSSDLQGHLAQCREGYDPFVIVVALADLFCEQVNLLVESGELSEEEARDLVTIDVVKREP